LADRLNRLLDRYFGELLNGGDFSAAAAAPEILAPGFRFYGPTYPEGRDAAGLHEFLSLLRRGFSDKRFVELDRLVAGDRAAVRFRMTGTHDGLFQGVPPTRRATVVEGCDLFRLSPDHDRILEVRAYFDLLTLLSQLGVIPKALS
jgi:predicted ester cyclase